MGFYYDGRRSQGQSTQIAQVADYVLTISRLLELPIKQAKLELKLKHFAENQGLTGSYRMSYWCCCLNYFDYFDLKLIQQVLLEMACLNECLYEGECSLYSGVKMLVMAPMSYCYL